MTEHRAGRPAAPAASAVGRVALIIVHWNTPALLERCLEAVALQTRPPDRVLVINNGQPDAGLERIGRRFPAVELVHLHRNAGFAAANNVGIALVADCRWCALLNPDAIPVPAWLAALLQAARAHPECASFASHLVSPSDPNRLDGLGDVYHVSGLPWRRRAKLRQNETWQPFSACAAAALYRRDAIVEVGGFDEDLFCYIEDVDLGFRLRLAGYDCRYVPDAVAAHAGSASSGDHHSDFAVYHGHRNIVWAWVKNTPAPLVWRHLAQHVLVNLVTLVSFSVRGQASTIWRAKRDALKGMRAMVRKRSAVAARSRTDWRTLRASMAGGWLRPYIRLPR